MNEELININDLEDVSVIHDLRNYVDYLYPSKSFLISNFEAGNDIQETELRVVLDYLFDVVLKHCNLEGKLIDGQMLKLEDTIGKISGQL